MNNIELAWLTFLTYTNEAKTLCRASVYFVTGRHTHKVVSMDNVRTDIFQYYYFGATIEVLEYTDTFQFVDAHDIDIDARKKWNIGVSYALTFDNASKSILAADGFVYPLEQSLFARNHRQAFANIMECVGHAANMAIVFYTLNGGLLHINFAYNLSPDAPYYKYAMHTGFVTIDSKKLKGLVPKTQKEFDSKEVLKQDDIDKLLKELQVV